MSAREWWAIKLRESDQLKHTIAGAGAGLVTSVVTCPLDVVKTRLQNQGVIKPTTKKKSYKGTAGTLTRIWSEEGIRGLYRGLGPTIFGYLPTWAIYFTAYDYFKDLIARQTGHHESNLFVYVLAAMSAGATSTTITNPLWVIKTRFMTQNEHTPYRYNNTLHAFTTIYKVEGYRGFYKGLGSSLMGITHVALQFPLYEKLRQWLKSRDTDHVSSTNILIASSTSKMAASIATYPHEVIRTRLQNQSTYPPKYKGIIHACKLIYQEEGIRAFYKGMPTNLLRTVPASALTILTYELIVGRLNEIAKPA
ncbi:MAG: mitochondrial carrier domain-containing protein [Benniella sp.]|nr:MAG: mitochondrial carrier domain-containing protein [Benniella sp.]